MSITMQRVIFWGTLAVIFIGAKLIQPTWIEWLHALKNATAG